MAPTGQTPQAAAQAIERRRRLEDAAFHTFAITTAVVAVVLSVLIGSTYWYGFNSAELPRIVGDFQNVSKSTSEVLHGLRIDIERLQRIVDECNLDDLHGLRTVIDGLQRIIGEFNGKIDRQESEIKNELTRLFVTLQDQTQSQFADISTNIQKLNQLLDKQNHQEVSAQKGESGVCKTLKPPDDIYIVSADGSTNLPVEYVPGTEIKFKCRNAGAFLLGADKIFCSSNLEWSSPWPTGCKRAQDCARGTYVASEPQGNMDRQCIACPNGKFSLTNNHPRPCKDMLTTATKCGMNQYAKIQPTASSDRVCDTCPSGKYQGHADYTGDSCHSISPHLPIESCSASSEYNQHFRCENAFNGIWADGNDRIGHGNAWATRGQGADSWIRLNFEENYFFNTFRYQQRGCQCELYKQIRLEFSNGHTRTLDLPKDSGPRTMTFDWAGPANSVRIYAVTHWTVVNNGFAEVQFGGVQA